MSARASNSSAASWSRGRAEAGRKHDGVLVELLDRVGVREEVAPRRLDRRRRRARRRSRRGPRARRGTARVSQAPRQLARPRDPVQVEPGHLGGSRARESALVVIVVVVVAATAEADLLLDRVHAAFDRALRLASRRRFPRRLLEEVRDALRVVDRLQVEAIDGFREAEVGVDARDDDPEVDGQSSIPTSETRTNASMTRPRSSRISRTSARPLERGARVR